MPADNIAHLPTDPLATDQRVRVLEVHHRVLAEQMAEISVAMHDIKSGLQRGDGRMGGLEEVGERAGIYCVPLRRAAA